MDYALQRGLVMTGACSFDEWAALGTRLHQAHEWIQFTLGDWLNYGEAQFGESYAQAIDPSWDAATLAQYQRVAAAVPPDRRIDGLSFFHHRAVAALPPAMQDRWLEAAKEGTDGRPWTVDRLRREVRQDSHESVIHLYALASVHDAADGDALADRLRAEGRTVAIVERQAKGR